MYERQRVRDTPGSAARGPFRLGALRRSRTPPGVHPARTKCATANAAGQAATIGNHDRAGP